jgi:hypothetical protein
VSEPGAHAEPARDDDWRAAWQPLFDRVGDDLDGGAVRFGPDAVDASAIRRYLEPLEFDCVLHRDADSARAHGWPDLVAPYVSVWSFMMPPAWEPGDGPTFPAADRDTQPRRSPIADDHFPGAPPTDSVFGTGVSMEFDRPLHVGERVGVGPRRLVACEPKQTRVGRGAFVTFERDVVTGSGERICRITAQIYLYDAHGAGAHDG